MIVIKISFSSSFLCQTPCHFPLVHFNLLPLNFLIYLSLSLQEVRSSLRESEKTSSELGQKLQEVQLARSSAEQVCKMQFHLTTPQNVSSLVFPLTYLVVLSFSLRVSPLHLSLICLLRICPSRSSGGPHCRWRSRERKTGSWSSPTNSRKPESSRRYVSCSKSL